MIFFEGAICQQDFSTLPYSSDLTIIISLSRSKVFSGGGFESSGAEYS